MKVKSVLLVCLVLMWGRALCQNPEPLYVALTAKQYNGTAYCGDLFQTVGFTGGYGTTQFTNNVAGPNEYLFYMASPHFCNDTIRFSNSGMVPLTAIRKFPSHLNVKVEETIILFFGEIYSAFREVSFPLTGNPGTRNYIIHRNTNPQPPREGGVFSTVDGFTVTHAMYVPQIPINSFYAYNNPARSPMDQTDRFCYGDRMYVDNFYKRPSYAIENSRFRYALTIPGQRTREFTTNDITGNISGGISIADPMFADITTTVTAKLKVRMIGPLIDGMDGVLGPWSEEQNITIYPRPPQLSTANINPAIPLTDQSSLTEGNSLVTLRHISCNDNNNGKIILDLHTSLRYHVFVNNATTGQNMDYKAYGPIITLPDDAFNDPSNSNEPFPFDAGVYMVRLQTIDPVTGLDFGCFSTEVFTLKQPGPLQLTATPSNYNGFSISCREDNLTGLPSDNASIQVVPTGGITPYTISAESVAGGFPGPSRQLTVPATATFANLPALIGNNPLTYTVRATDAEGCPQAISPPIPMTAPEKIVIDEVDDDFAANQNNNIRCFGGADDTQVFITGGTHTFSSWVDGNGYFNYQRRDFLEESIHQVVYSGLIATTPTSPYTVHAVDENGCHARLEFGFRQPDKLTFESQEITNADCSGNATGAIKVNAVGGIAFSDDQYKYSLTGYPDQIAVDATFAMLGANTYNIKITDAFGCTQTYPLVVTEPDAIQLRTTTTDVICFGAASGTAKATFSGGTAPYTLDWLDADKNTISTIPFASAGENTMTGRPAGDHYAHITDSHGCEEEIFTLIAQPFAPLQLTAEPADVIAVSCNGQTDGEATMQVDGGWLPYSIGTSLSSLQPDAFRQTDLAPGTHTIYVQDLKGCVDTYEVTIDEPDVLKVTATDIAGVSCFGDTDGAFTPNITGGTAPYDVMDATGTWIDEGRVGGLDAGTFHATVRDYRSCLAEVDVLIVEPEELDALVRSITDTKCGEANGAVEVDVTGGTVPYSAEWKLDGDILNTDVDPVGLPAGVYDVEIIDAHNCRVPLSAAISSSDGAVIEIQSTSPVTCADGSDGAAEVSVTGGTLPYIDIAWTNGEAGVTAIALVKGANFITVEDNVGCIVTKQVDIDGPDPIDGNFTATPPTCFGDKDGNLVVEAVGGFGPYEYLWVGTANNTNQAGSLEGGQHNISITDSKGCNAIVEYILAQPDPVVVTLSGEELICTGMDVTLDAGNEGSAYSWTSTNDFTSTERVITIDSTGAYTVVVTDPRGCTGTATFELTVDSNILKADFLASSEVIAGDTLVFINITFPVPDATTWSFPDGGDIVRTTLYTQEVVFDNPGTYSAILSASKGDCNDTYQSSIMVLEPEVVASDESGNGRRSSVIRSFDIHPNPTNGRFTVTVDLDEEAPVSLDVISMKAVSTQARYSDFGKAHYQIDVQLDVAPGMYTVMLNVGNERLARRIIIY